jgi:hypothetical protein
VLDHRLGDHLFDERSDPLESVAVDHISPKVRARIDSDLEQLTLWSMSWKIER